MNPCNKICVKMGRSDGRVFLTDDVLRLPTGSTWNQFAELGGDQRCSTQNCIRLVVDDPFKSPLGLDREGFEF